MARPRNPRLVPAMFDERVGKLTDKQRKALEACQSFVAGIKSARVGYSPHAIYTPQLRCKHVDELYDQIVESLDG